MFGVAKIECARTTPPETKSLCPASAWQMAGTLSNTARRTNAAQSRRASSGSRRKPGTSRATNTQANTRPSPTSETNVSTDHATDAADTTRKKSRGVRAGERTAMRSAGDSTIWRSNDVARTAAVMVSAVKGRRSPAGPSLNGATARRNTRPMSGSRRPATLCFIGRLIPAREKGCRGRPVGDPVTPLRSILASCGAQFE